MIQESFHREDMMPVLEQFIDYLRHERRGGLSEGTIERYLLDLRHLQQQTGKHLFDLKVYRDVGDAIRALKVKNGWSRSTTKTCANGIAVFYNWAARYQHIKENPMQYGHEFKLGELTQMDFFDWEDPSFLKMLYSPDNTIQENAILHTLRSSGLRAAPVCRLKFRNPCDIDLKQRVLRVRKDKGGTWHEVCFDEENQKWLTYHLEFLERHTQLDYLFQRKAFTQPYTPDTLRKLIFRKADRLSLHACPQKFRRSLGGQLISNGADLTMVKEQLGHKRISTTADHYTHFTTKQKKENYSRYVPKLNLPPSTFLAEPALQ